MVNVDGGACVTKDLLVTTSYHNYYDWIMIFTRVTIVLSTNYHSNSLYSYLQKNLCVRFIAIGIA